LGIIAGILFLAPVFGITGVALGVILGALLYLLIQIPPAVKCGFRYSAAVRARDSSIKRILWLMAPRTFGIAANQINQIVTNAIASTLAAGSVAIFNLANNLYSFPVGIFGVSWAMAAFPAFSKHFASLDLEGLAKKFSASWRQVAYFVLPISFLMFALRGPIVSVLYFHGKFTAEAAALAAASLGLFCLGIYFASLIPGMFRLFFSFHDTASPTVSTVVSVAANVALNFVFIGQLKNGSFLEQGLRQIFGLQSISDISILGLSLAYSAANILQFSVLTALLFFRKPGLIRTKEITHSFTKALAASVIMFFAADAMNAKIHPAGTLEILIAAGAISLAAAAIYLAATAVFRSPELAVATAEIKRKFKKNGTPGRDR
jgi:putative peptidoglycan lipid II flippase